MTKHNYNAESVQRAIKSDKRIKNKTGKEARLVHALLKGRK